MRRNYGMAAEEAAALFLEEKGIRILERNFRSYHGEIDIIALEKEIILIVEVKMRRNKECGTPAFTSFGNVRNTTPFFSFIIVE